MLAAILLMTAAVAVAEERVAAATDYLIKASKERSVIAKGPPRYMDKLDITLSAYLAAKVANAVEFQFTVKNKSAQEITITEKDVIVDCVAFYIKRSADGRICSMGRGCSQPLLVKEKFPVRLKPGASVTFHAVKDYIYFNQFQIFFSLFKEISVLVELERRKHIRSKFEEDI